MRVTLETNHKEVQQEGNAHHNGYGLIWGAGACSTTLFQLEVFCRVVDCRGVSAAAGELHLTQPAVSRYLRRLEREVGVALFRREGRRSVLTPAGSILYGKVRHILPILETALAEIRNIHRQPLVVGTSHTCLPGFLQATITAFGELRQDVSVLLRLDDHERILRAVLDGAIDLGIVWSPVRTARVRTVQLGWERYDLVCGAGTSIAGDGFVEPAVLAGAPFVCGWQGSVLRHYEEEWLGRIGIHPVASVEVASVADAIRAVSKGAGLAFLPHHEVRSALECGDLVILHANSLDRFLYREINAVMPLASPNSLNAEFLDFFRTRIELLSRRPRDTEATKRTRPPRGPQQPGGDRSSWA